MSLRSLSVLGDAGAGKKTLVGGLIYVVLFIIFLIGSCYANSQWCGLGLSQLEELERKGIQYGDIVTFFEKRGQPLCFHAPSGLFEVEKSQTPDVAIWVVDGSESLTWAASATKLAALLSNGELLPRESLVIAINKITSFIPVSASKGQNVLPDSKEPSWATSLSPQRFGGSEVVSSDCLIRLLA
ncbi:hypothetical protein DER46DRAFT_590893 [Fusarium sp. MPI-SDFR-AT-0072]|nr:hypothetical protein DER46DRAFT_590893 [Fusarium sp. MPI-SDFR-AT-0072]